MSPLKISILGSTGSVGRQTLDVCRWFPEKLQVEAISAGANWSLLAQQIREFRPALAALYEEKHYPSLKEAVAGTTTEIIAGPEGASLVAAYHSAQLTVAAMPGLAGLRPALKAVEAGKDLALANKEVLVAAGELTTTALRRQNTRLLTLDSEHSAICQCLTGEPPPAALILTASGGPFRTKTQAQLEQVTAAEALRHPTWDMGQKITIDSASLANKGLEVIEAHWLFGVDYEAIEVLVHPQSIVHSLVRFPDGSVKAQLGLADMRLPIQYALLGPERPPNDTPQLDLASIGNLTFEPPDTDRFPALKLAYQAGKAGGSYPAAYNSANELLGAAFLTGKIPFTAIGAGIETALEQHQPLPITKVEDVLHIDQEIQALLTDFVNKNRRG